jgi:hypothetical protein
MKTLEELLRSVDGPETIEVHVLPIESKCIVTVTVRDEKWKIRASLSGQVEGNAIRLSQ